MLTTPTSVMFSLYLDSNLCFMLAKTNPSR